MYYRRNSDSELRNLEREFSSSGDPSVLLQINRLRRRQGLPPHPAARIKAAESLLGDIMCRGVASQIRNFVDVYLDPVMYISTLPDNSPMRLEAIATLEEYQRFIDEWRVVSEEIAVASAGREEEDRYISLLDRYGLKPSPLGPEIDVPEPKEGHISFLSPHYYRRGMSQRVANIEIVSRLVCQQAIKVFRKMLLLGMVNVQEILEEEPEMAEEWEDYPLGLIGNFLDDVETAMSEIDRATIGVAPSPEAVELFSEAWYGQ